MKEKEVSSKRCIDNYKYRPPVRSTWDKVKIPVIIIAYLSVLFFVFYLCEVRPC